MEKIPFPTICQNYSEGMPGDGEGGSSSLLYFPIVAIPYLLNCGREDSGPSRILCVLPVLNKHRRQGSCNHFPDYFPFMTFTAVASDSGTGKGGKPLPNLRISEKEMGTGQAEQ